MWSLVEASVGQTDGVREAGLKRAYTVMKYPQGHNDESGPDEVFLVTPGYDRTLAYALACRIIRPCKHARLLRRWWINEDAMHSLSIHDWIFFVLVDGGVIWQVVMDHVGSQAGIARSFVEPDINAGTTASGLDGD